MNSKQILQSILYCTGLLATGVIHDTEASETKKNVLLIYTDDHRFSGVHALGKQQVITPNIDNLANEGIAFTNTYLQGAFTGATCMPSRAMLLSGRGLFKLQGNGWGIPTSHTTIGEAFQKAGYATHVIGKWDQDNQSLLRSFDGGATIMGRGLYLTDQFRMPIWDWDNQGNYKKEDAYLLVHENHIVKRRPVLATDTNGPIGTEANGPHTSEIFAKNAIKYINDSTTDKPFFMYLAFHAPHDPRQAPEKYRRMYSVDSIKLPPSYMPQHPFDNGEMTLRDETLAPWPRTPAIVKKEIADYYSAITHLDTQIGHVIASLKKKGIYDNTLIILAGDSGLAVGSHGLMGKQSLYDEAGIHVPFIISGSGIKDKGRRIDAFSYIHDIFPTICDLAKIKKPESVLGKSLLPVINKDRKEIRTVMYHAYRQFQRAYRKGDYKLIEYVRADDKPRNENATISGSRVTQLFNIKNDPWETTDLSFYAEHKKRIAEMRTEMKQKAIELNDTKKTVGQKFDFWDYYK